MVGQGCESWVAGSKTGAKLTDCGGFPKEISAKYWAFIKSSRVQSYVTFGCTDGHLLFKGTV